MSKNRYSQLRTKTLPSGKVVYYPAIPISAVADENQDQTIVTDDVDRLDVMAKNVYGKSEYWWKIASANGMVNGSVYVAPNTTLIIPK